VKSRLVLAGAAAGVVAVALYAVMRTVQFFVAPDPNPATVIWSAHAGYFWRALTVAYASVAIGFVIHQIAPRREEKLAAILVPAVSIAIVLAVAQALFFP
jgi:hypothetical protein